MDVVSWVELLDFPSCLFWLDSPCSGAVLSNRTCNVSLLCICLSMEVTTNHVTSVTYKTFLRYTPCTVKIVHLQFSGLHLWIVQPLPQSKFLVFQHSRNQELPCTHGFLHTHSLLWTSGSHQSTFQVCSHFLWVVMGIKLCDLFLCARPPSSSIICLQFIRVWGCSILEWEQETHKVVFPCSVISLAVLISLLLASFAAFALFLIGCCGPCGLAERCSALAVVLYQSCSHAADGGCLRCSHSTSLLLIVGCPCWWPAGPRAIYSSSRLEMTVV